MDIYLIGDVLLIRRVGLFQSLLLLLYIINDDRPRRYCAATAQIFVVYVWLHHCRIIFSVNVRQLDSGIEKSVIRILVGPNYNIYIFSLQITVNPLLYPFRRLPSNEPPCILVCLKCISPLRKTPQGKVLVMATL